MQNTENTTFLALLSLNSALKWKVAPPLAFPRLVYEHFFLCICALSVLGLWNRDYFRWRPFFWSSPEIGQKKRPNLGEDLFLFGLHLNSSRNNAPILSEDLFIFLVFTLISMKKSFQIQTYFFFFCCSLAMSFGTGPPLQISGYVPEIS